MTGWPVARIVDRYYAVYTGPACLAVLDISLGVRDDTAMRGRLRDQK